MTDDPLLEETLTPRQRAIVRSAVEEGFYAFPRRITLTHLAARIGVSKSTLSETLILVESQIFGRLIRGPKPWSTNEAGTATTN